MTDKGIDSEPLLTRASTPDEVYQDVLDYQDELIAAFTGGTIQSERYSKLRSDLLKNPAYGGLAPSFIRRCRDTGALWSFAKSVDPSWEPRRQFVRAQFEPLLELLEGAQIRPSDRMPGDYDPAAWTGIQEPAQKARAMKSTIPVMQAAIECLISHLEKPNHNGSPPLEEVEIALTNLRGLHAALGQLLQVVEDGQVSTEFGQGLITEVARFARRAAKSLKHDPVPYALSGTLLALMTASGFPGLGGYLAGVVLAIKKGL